MIAKDFIGYSESADISKVSEQYCVYPSKNCLIYKGVIYSRPGIQNDGNAPSIIYGKTNGEFVWKDALGGEKACKVSGNTLFVKLKGIWIPFFTGISPTTLRVRFATWIDDNGAIVKKRLFFVDGTDAIYEWNGGVSYIQSVAGNNFTIQGTKTPEQIGFDPGNATPQNIQVIRLASGAIVGTDVYTNTDNAEGSAFTVSGTVTNVPNANDIIIASVVTHHEVLTGILKDDLYTFKNRLGIGCLTDLRVYFSDGEVKLSYTEASSETALTPFHIDLPGNYTAMISRYNELSSDSTLWISDVDGWTKMTLALDADPVSGTFVKEDRVFNAERTGALPFAVSEYNGDIIFFGYDNKVQQVTTLLGTQRDVLKLISDDVEDMLKRYDKTECRIYFLERYIYILLPSEATMLMIDMISNKFQPPQTIGAGYLSVIQGVLYGHSNAIHETFYMFKGRNDLNSDISTVIAFPYHQGGIKGGGEFSLKQFTQMGLSTRQTPTTVATVKEYFETDGSKATTEWTVDGSKATSYTIPDDESWASHIWGDSSIGAADGDPDSLLRIFHFDKYDALAWFEFRPIITISGRDQEFHLLAWFIDESISNRKFGDELYTDVDSDE